jgi:NAD-dependent protein deacetylase/lipoamidase
MDESTEKKLRYAAQWLADSLWAVALTGAGLSVDSGIPDFRSPGGLWDRFDPFEYAHVEAFHTDPIKVWQMLKELSDLVINAKPNPGHHSLVELSEMGILQAVITQNIDNLHQEAGSPEVIEFHGNGNRLVCLSCGWTTTADKAHEKCEATGEFPPSCESCGSIMKPEVIFFGEPIPAKALMDSQEQAQKADLILVVGTSATVVPASNIPLLTKRAGGRIVEINLETTALSPMADVTLLGSTTDILPRLVQAVREIKGV